MKSVIFFLSIFFFSFIQAQKLTPQPIFDNVIDAVTKSYSNFGVSSPINIKKSDADSLKLTLYSSTKTEISLIEEFFVFDLNDVTDVFLVPSGADEFKLIVSLKENVLIKKRNTDFKNVFHEEVITEDLRESADLWFLFTTKNDAQKLEIALMEIKKSIQR